MLEKPHSLSYQATSLTKLPLRAMPALASKMEVWGSVRKSHGHTGELAVELGDDLADSLGSAGGGGDDVVVDGTGTAQILLLGEAVNDGLGGGGSVNRGHEAFDNAEVVIDNLGDGSQAVGGAGSVGDKLHISSILLKVDAADEHRGVVLRGAGHDNDLGAGVNVGLGLRLVEVNAGALENILNTELAPRNQGSIAVGLVRENLDNFAVHGNRAVLIVADNFAIEAAVHGVILDTVCNVRCGMAGSVDRDDFDIVRLDRSTERERTDAAETIDANFNHVYSSK